MISHPVSQKWEKYEASGNLGIFMSWFAYKELAQQGRFTRIAKSRWEANDSMDFEVICCVDFNGICWVQDELMGFNEGCDKLFNSVTWEEFLDQLSNYKLLWKDSALWI
jgi:hypothetical protein